MTHLKPDNKLCTAFDDATTGDGALVKYGKGYLDKDEEGWYTYDSEYDHLYGDRWKFCPYCGAKL